MAKARVSRVHINDLRGAVRLAVEGVKGVTHIAQGLHGSIANVAPPLGGAQVKPAGGIAGFVYGAVRTTSGLAGSALDAALAAAQALLPPEAEQSSASRDAWLAAVNGVVGDYLERTNNPLATRMELLPAKATGAYLLVLVHGLCMNDQQWLQDGHDHGAALAADLGYTPLYLRYNSGRHISSNGEDFAKLLEERIASSPVRVETITLLGHSMGGLVARSAVHAAQSAEMTWPTLLRKMVFLGTPHHGAALERGGNRLDRVFGLSPYLAPFLRVGAIRSDGITDLRHGNGPVPLPPAVPCYAIAGTLADARAQALLGDGLVSVDSALGRNARPTRDLHLPASRTWIARGVGHLGLLGSPAVYQRLRRWLDVKAPAASRSPSRPKAPAPRASRTG